MHLKTLLGSAGVLILGAALLLLAGRRGPAPEARPEIARSAPTAAPAPALDRAAKAGQATPSPPANEPLPMDVEHVPEYLKNGPQEPLVPPVIEVEARPAPGSIVAAEPLVPPVIEIEGELAAKPLPGEVPTMAPLVPPVIPLGEP